jgi:hypothetical protein
VNTVMIIVIIIVVTHQHHLEHLIIALITLKHRQVVVITEIILEMKMAALKITVAIDVIKWDILLVIAKKLQNDAIGVIKLDIMLKTARMKSKVVG